MSDVIILNDIQWKPNPESLMKQLHIRPGTRHVADLTAFITQAQDVARPKAVYKVAYVKARTEDTVVVDGAIFSSRVLRVNLDSAHRVFPYVATCGKELAAWSQAIDDMLHRYWADVIQQSAVSAAARALNKHLDARYHLGRASAMSPGSLADWPIRQQQPLFELLGDVQGAIGVRLSESMLMIPAKSISGIRFPTEESFESCQLCPREKCPGRRAPYDPTLYERKYQKPEAAS